MTDRDIIGVDVIVEFSDGNRAQGHLSPVGTHFARNPQDSRLPAVLDTLRASIEDRFRPYKSQRRVSDLLDPDERES